MNNDQQQLVQINDSFLASLGLGDLSEEDKQLLIAKMQEELEERVGTELAKDLSDEQLDEFGEIIEAGDQEAATAWLTENCPNYQAVVMDTLEKLKHELTENREALLQGVHDEVKEDDEAAPTPVAQ